METETFRLAGRRKIFSLTEDLNEQNILAVVNNALSYHMRNLHEEEYLYWYRRGITPILEREKEIHKDICNRIVENHADEIVSFKNGYFLTQPAKYVARKEESIEKVSILNEYLYRSGKTHVDNELVDWFHTVGVATLYVTSDTDPDVPVKVYALDPRQAFVVYSMKPGNAPLYGVNIVIDGNVSLIDVYTKDKVFRLYGGAANQTADRPTVVYSNAVGIRHIERNPLGYVPIIEYQYNSLKMGAFESVIPLLDAIDTVASNRVDGVEQFIQSLAVATNCEFEEGTTVDQIRQAGMLLLKSTSEQKADFTILSEQLDQQQTQTLVNNLYDQVLRICGMPIQNSGSSSFDATGQAILANNGWYQADTVARNTADMFTRANRYFDEIFISILKRKNIVDIGMNDFELQIVQNETANIQSKAQAYNTLVQGGFHPILAMKKSGVSNDPTADFTMSKEYIDMKIGDPEKETADETDAMGRTEQPSDGAGDGTEAEPSEETE